MEMVVALTILAMTSGMLISLFLSNLKGATKSRNLTSVKQNGDYALAVMERMIRNSRQVTACSASSLTIMGSDNQLTTFTCSGAAADQLASNSAYLTSDENAVTSCATIFTFDACPNPAMVGIGFTLERKFSGGLPPGEGASIPFQTTVTLRNR